MKVHGSEYYEYVLLYTDDALVINESSEYVPREHIEKYFDLKEESIQPPKIYLRGRLFKVEVEV